MDMGFHYKDVPPQNWLDDLHKYNIPRLWDVQLDNNQRENLAKRAQDQLTGWRKGLRDQMKAIEGRYDASNAEKKEQVLAAYKLLDSLGSDLNSQLQDLMARVKAGRAIPEGFAFGTYIFGDMASKRWHLGTREDERRWDEFMRVERRYRGLVREYKAQKQELINARKRVKDTQEDIASATKEYRRRSGFLQIGLFLFIIIITVIVCLVLGGFILAMDFTVWNGVTNEMVSALLLILSVVGVMIGYVLARRRRVAVAELQSDLKILAGRLKKVKEEAQRQKKLFYPTEHTFKEVTAEYKTLKASFG